MLKRIIHLSLLTIGLAACLPVCALEMSMHQYDGKRILLLEKAFEPGDAKDFDKYVRSAGAIDEIWFNSPGGSVFEGMEIGRKIRSLGLATRVPNKAICASICAFSFLGGVIRDVEPTGKFGVHMFSMSGSPELLQKVEAMIRAEGANGAKKVVVFLEQTSAKTAKGQADYLLEMSISLRLLYPNYETSNDGIYWLPREELLSYNVVNTGN